MTSKIRGRVRVEDGPKRIRTWRRRLVAAIGFEQVVVTGSFIQEQALSVGSLGRYHP